MKLGNRLWNQALLLGICVLVSGCGGCSVENKEPAGPLSSGTPGGKLSGEINIEGSSTVEPVTQAVAAEFKKLHPDVLITVTGNGSGSGFEALYRGEVPISDASRAIKDKEKAECEKNGIKFIELQIGVDGLTVVVNKENNWCDKITVAQLKKLWEPGSTVKKWNELDPNWPDEEIKLYGPGRESGTFDYFTEEIVGTSGSSRSDYSSSANDNFLVKGVAGEKYALGYFGYAYYIENADAIKAVAVSATDNPDDAVLPNQKTVASGAYKPLSRPLFIYVNTAELSRPDVKAFLNYYMEKGQDFVKEVGYVGLHEDELATMKQRLQEALDAASKSSPE